LSSLLENLILEQAPRGTALTFHTAFRAFDAKTGNLIVIGALNRPAAL